jgi:glycosyltransferase involved in cell wall biosynthesis
MLDEPEVVHFHQVLNAYGSKGVFAWLKQPLSAARVVTVHELDCDQLERPEENTIYNRADAVIVHCEDMKDRLVRLKVDQDRVHIVLHGTVIPDAKPNNSRDGIVFYGGHKLMSGKGIDTVFKAMSLIRRQRPHRTPMLKIHGHYGTETPAEALKLAAEHGITDHIVWLNQMPEEDVVPLYQESLVCLLPFTGSFAGLAASTAAACQLPVVGTRKAGLPDHLGDAGVWVDENNPEQLAARAIELLDSEKLRGEVGARLLKRAEDHLSWDVVADRTLKIYQEAAQQRALAA